MASAQQTGQNLRRIARALEAAPDAAVRAAAREVAADAAHRGGSFYNGAAQLGADITATGKGAVRVSGSPAGAWAIKSFGRSASVARGRALGRPGGSFHAKRSRAARGDRRWEQVIRGAQESAPRAAAAAVHEAVS